MRRRCLFQQVWRALGCGITLLLFSTAQVSPDQGLEGTGRAWWIQG